MLNIAALSEDPLEDFKKKREERRRIQTPSQESQNDQRSDMLKESGISRQGTPCGGQYATKKSSSCLTLVRPINVAIQNTKTSDNDQDENRDGIRCTGGTKFGLFAEPLCRSREISAIPSREAFCKGDCQCQNVEGQKMGRQNVKGQNGERKYSHEEAEDHSVCNKIWKSQQIVYLPGKEDDSISGAEVESHRIMKVNLPVARHVKEGQSTNDHQSVKCHKPGENRCQNVIVKATKFLLNGEICYVIPAKVVVNQVNQVNQGQELESAAHKPINAGQRSKCKVARLIPENDELLKQKGLRMLTEGNDESGSQETSCAAPEPKLRVNSLVHIEWHPRIKKGFFWFAENMSILSSFTALRSPAGKADQAESDEISGKDFLHYPSLKRLERHGKSYLRVKRLDQGQNREGKVEMSQGSEVKDEAPGKCQLVLLNYLFLLLLLLLLLFVNSFSQ